MAPAMSGTLSIVALRNFRLVFAVAAALVTPAFGQNDAQSIPDSSTMTFRYVGNGPLDWQEQACAENLFWYPGKEADVPRADKPDF